MALILLLHNFAGSFAYIYYVIPFFINLFFNRLFKKGFFYLICRFKRSNQINPTGIITKNHHTLADNNRTNL